MNRWKDHFVQLLNQLEPAIRPVIGAAYTGLHTDTGPPNRGEINKAVWILNDGKAAALMLYQQRF